jgi:hypothetical protein
MLKFRATPILVEMEAQPVGWAQHVFNHLINCRNVYFICDKEGAANGGFGIPMGNGNKLFMAQLLDMAMGGGLKLAPEPFLMSNVTDFKIRNHITPTNRDSYLLKKTQVGLQALQYTKDPKTGTVSVSGKMEGTDDIWMGGFHGLHADKLIGQVGQGHALRRCFRHSSNDAIPNLKQGEADWNYIMRPFATKPPLE